MRASTCERCGARFSGRKATARFCDAACRKAAWRERRAADAASGDAAGVSVSLKAVSGGDAPVLVVDAVEEGPRAGLVALAGWLAETLDGLDGAARAVHGPKVAAQLTAALKALREPAASAAGRPPNRLAQLREARAAQEAARG